MNVLFLQVKGYVYDQLSVKVACYQKRLKIFFCEDDIISFLMLQKCVCWGEGTKSLKTHSLCVAGDCLGIKKQYNTGKRMENT